MSESPAVFISYPHDGADSETLATQLYQHLLKEDISVFLDKESINLGNRWIKELSDSTKNCKIMLCLVSPAAHDRPWVEKEFLAAYEAGAVVIPVLSTEGPLPFQLNDLQASRVYGPAKKAELEKLTVRIKYLLNHNTSDRITQQPPRNQLAPDTQGVI